MVREMLVHILSEQEIINVVGEAGTLAESRAAIARSHPDVVLLDIAFPDGSGTDFARELKEANPDVRLIFVTAMDQEETVLTAVSTGAEGYLARNSSCEQLVCAVKAIASGGFAFDSSVVAPILRRVAGSERSGLSSSDHDLTELSSREREIALLIRQGLSNKEIAGNLSVSINTVKTHLRRIYQHLGISSRRELMPFRHTVN
jgi:DNA-binding NarL/FixJ family response regulator